MSPSEGWRLFRELGIFSIFSGGISCHSRSQTSRQETLCSGLSVLVFDMSRGALGSRPSTTGVWPESHAWTPPPCCLPPESHTPALATLWSPSIHLRAGGCRAPVIVGSTGRVWPRSWKAVGLVGEPLPSQAPALPSARGGVWALADAPGELQGSEAAAPGLSRGREAVARSLPMPQFSPSLSPDCIKVGDYVWCLHNFNRSPTLSSSFQLKGNRPMARSSRQAQVSSQHLTTSCFHVIQGKWPWSRICGYDMKAPFK